MTTTIEQHLDHARRAFGSGDFPSTLQHLGDALAIDPVDTPALQAAYYVLPLIPNAVGMTQIQSNTPPKMVAIHAMALGVSHDWNRAMDLLFRLGAQNPTVPYLRWAENWVHGHVSSLLLDFSVVGGAIVDFGDAFEEDIDSSDATWETLRAGTAVLAKLAETFVDNKSLRAIHVKLLRRGKRYDEALSVAAALRAHDPRLSALLSAWTYRDLRRVPEAIAAFRHANSIEIDDDIVLDIAKLQFDDAQFEASAATYQEIPQENQEAMAWAYPSNIAARYMATREPQLDQELASLAGRGNSRAKFLHALIHAYAEQLPLPRDLTAGVVRDLQAAFTNKPGQGTAAEPLKVGLTITSLESPSVHLAATMAARLGESFVKMNVTCEKEPKPNPRLPLLVALGAPNDVIYDQWAVWRYEGTDPMPAVPPPPANVLHAIGSLAATPYDWAAWLAATARLAPSFSGQLPSLLGAMVHPPSPPDRDRDVIEWIYHCQLVTALLIARLDGGWERTQRRAGLLSLVHNPIDWIASAALPAIGVVFAECPEARTEILQLFGALRRRVPDIGYCVYTTALEAVWSRLPGIDEASRREAFRRFVYATNKPFL
jgi:tetratricopeptide (TPR) repeat protein